jgi:CRP-like cAMP-binding protein
MPQSRKTATPVSGIVDPYVGALLKGITTGKTVLQLEKGDRIFSQGDPTDAIYFIQSGKVKISVISSSGKEAVLAMLGPHDFLGEGCLVRQTLRVSTATAMEASTLFRVDTRSMLGALASQAKLNEKFIALLLARNIDLEADLCDQLFNHSEKRLARVLLKLSRLRQTDVLPDATVVPLSHETLAEMVGTTRARITFFMNKFRKMGLIDYNGKLLVRTELLTDVVLHD